VSSDAEGTEGGVEFIHRAEGMDAGMGFRKAAAEEEIRLPFVPTAGGDGHGLPLRTSTKEGLNCANFFFPYQLPVT
jgi:hypothetical protein